MCLSNKHSGAIGLPNSIFLKLRHTFYTALHALKRDDYDTAAKGLDEEPQGQLINGYILHGENPTQNGTITHQ